MNTPDPIRAPVRRRPAVEKDPILLWAGLVGVGLLCLITLVQWVDRHKGSIVIGGTAETAPAAPAVQYVLVPAPAKSIPAAPRYEEPAPPPPRYGTHEPTAADNVREALRIMEETRQLRRQMDQQQYSNQAPNVVIGRHQSTTHEPAICDGMRSERDVIEAQQRRGYSQGQYYNERLRSIWTSMTDLRCDMSRYPSAARR